MMRLVFLSCLVFALALGEDAPSDPAVTSTPPVASADSVPTPDVSIALSTQASSDSKYFVYHTKLNWFQASELCLQFGKRLATFSSESEYNQISALVNSPDLSASYWTAGSDLGENNKYVWASTGRPLTYTRWAPGEPNHGKRGCGNCEVERCVEIRADYHYRLNDNFCSALNYFVCENV